MDTSSFLFKEELHKIESTFIQDGWVTIYENSLLNDDDTSSIFCCLIKPNKIKEYSSHSNWIIEPGREGKPSIINDKYFTNSVKGIEPFIFVKCFNYSNKSENYIDVSEEFILYFNLLEILETKQKRKYFYINEIGSLEEVLIITENKIQLKLKYLIEYISVRKLFFSICFDYMRVTSKTLQELNVPLLNKDVKGKSYIYNHIIRQLYKSQNWINGKAILSYDKKLSKKYHFNQYNEIYTEFITGYDSKGMEILQSCDKNISKAFVLTYFSKDVLNKYYNDPSKYTVERWFIKSNFFTLKVDNNIEDYIAVFLTDLSALPYNEQLHWKQFNIPPDNKHISKSYINSMIHGIESGDPETIDQIFKYKYKEFNKKWELKFGWPFYKPLSDKDKYILVSLHIPPDDNHKAINEQILSLVKLTIDRINESKLSENIQIEEKDRGITKLEKFLSANNVSIPDTIKFLKMLYRLRSGLFAHSFSNANKDCLSAMKYFKIDEVMSRSAANTIFLSSISTIEILEQSFKL